MLSLLLVDLQNDFMPGGTLAVPGGDQVVPIANRLLDRCRQSFASQDWHPSGHHSFASSHPGRKPFDVVRLQGLDQTLWPDHCVQGTHGAAFHSDLQTSKLAYVAQKGTDPRVDSYSAFFDSANRHQTELDAVLRSRGVNRLAVLGLATDYCVRATVLDACKLGYETVLVTDGCRAIDAPDSALREMSEVGVAFTTSDQLETTLSDAGG